MSILMTYESFSDKRMKEYESEENGFEVYLYDSSEETKKNLKEWTTKRIKEILPEGSEVFKDANPFSNKAGYVLSFKIDYINCFINFNTNWKRLEIIATDTILNKHAFEFNAYSLEKFIVRLHRILAEHIGPDNVNRRRSEAGLDKFDL